MEVQFGPNSVDEPSLLYKLQRKIKVFNVNDPLPNRGYNLVASSSKYGLVFIAVPDGTLSVYQLNQVIDHDCEPKHLTVQLQEKPTHISVSCDHELLAVTGGKLLAIYKVADFQNPNVSPALSIRTEIEPPTNPPYVTALQWNPCIPESIVIAYFDGTLLACLVNSGQVKKVTGRARCICWSPKGKQFVTGNSDGTLIQYKPELTAAKLIPAPNLFEGAPVEAIAIYWISTFQFAVVYRNASDNSRPAVTIVNTPKGAPQTCVSYEDICYSMGSNRPWYYYLHGLAQWNLIMTSSSNSMEIGTLGSTDGTNWMQWSQSDEARPELPLTDKKIENYPVGLCIDTCAIHQLPWGENDTLPHMPLLHVVSQHGLLTIFNIINLKRDQVPVCSPPHMLALPSQAMISAIPGAPEVVPKPATPAAPVPAAVPSSMPAVVQKVQIPTPQPAPQQPSAVAVSATIKIPSFAPHIQTTSATAAPSIFQPQQKAIPETVSAPATQPAPTQPVTVAQPKPQSQPTATPSQPQPQSQPQPTVSKPLPQENAALKAEQEKANKAKANQELKDMLVKEVNDFQTELYNFMVKTRETQVRLQRDIENISTNFNGITLDAEELKKECSMEELRGAIVQLKLELVRACAVVAEARTHSDTKDLHQWSQADPLTTKRIASVKKLAYYVQTQLAQAHAALDYKWNELSSRDSQNKKLGPRMIRPILDDVYQPLVKQQEILGRQQAVLRTLKSALAECEMGPVFKSTSILRSTPFKNKDPLSKLTKNILNMSLEPETKPKRHVLTPSKLDALKDMLSNHKTVKIKPVNVELRQHLETLKKNYEQSFKDKAEKIQSLPPPAKAVKIKEQKPKPAKPEAVKSVPTSIFTPVPNMKFAPGPNVVRSLFGEAPKQETTAPRSVFKPFEYPAQKETISFDTKSVLKDVLTNRQANTEAKNNNNSFMGQKICSPTVFGQTFAPTPSSAPTAVFTAKPIADMNNMFNKFQPQLFVPESKSSLNARQPDAIPKSAANVKSSETGEPEDNEAPKQKQITHLFGLKNDSLPLAASTPLPTTLKVAEVPQAKPRDKLAEKTKENVPKTDPKGAVKKETKPLTSQASNKGFVFGAPPNESTSSSIATPKPQSAFTVPSSSVKTEPLTPSESETSSASTSASSIFGAAVASLPTTTSASIPASVFTSTPTTSIFGSPSSQIAPNKLATTSANSIFEPVTTSQPIFSNTLPPLSQSVSQPHVGHVTERLKAEAEEKAGEAVFKQRPPSIVPLNPNLAHPQATYITEQLKHQTGDLPAMSIFKPTPTLQPTSTTTSTSDSNAFGSSSVSVKSVFGSNSSAFGTTTSTAVSVFGVPSIADSTATITSVASSAATSVSESSVSSASPTATNTATTPPVYDFTISAPSTTSSSAMFEAPTPSVATTATTPSIFESVITSTATTSTPSIFGSIPAVTSTATTTPAAFGSSASSVSPSVFASPQAEATSAFTPTTSSIFGGSSQAASVFAQASSSIFGTTTQASIFGATTQASIFGSPTNATQASIFGTPTATTQTSIFGTPTQASSVFGSPAQTTQASVFGTPTQTTQASIFGSSAPTTQASIFGASNQASVFGTPAQTTQASVFGSPTPTTQASVFGATTQTSVFGTPTQTTQASIFGQPATTQSGGSLFGGGENLFAAASISTTSASSPNSGGNIFGSPSGSVFGGGATNVFGSKSAFGQQSPTPSSIFGGGASFGQKPATNIWGSGNANGSGFGSSSGFGQTATTQSSSIFGSTGGSFSQPSGGAFSAPPQPSAFGSPTQQQASGFGGGAVFGSKPLFGQPAGFGSSGFGSPASFGGLNKSPTAFGAPAFGGGSVFGGGSPGGGFGASTQSNATFESLATQNTLTFGNLAQQTASPQPAAPSFNTSPSFTGWRG